MNRGYGSQFEIGHMSPQERAAFIKGELRRLNIWQYTVASSLGVSDAAVNRVIYGNRGSGYIARAIAEAIGQPFDDLFPEIAERETQRALKMTNRPVPVHIDLAALEALRKKVKHLMVDLELDRPSSYDTIAPYLHRPANRKLLSMALTGYQQGKADQALLQDLLEVLSSWAPREAA